MLGEAVLIVLVTETGRWYRIAPVVVPVSGNSLRTDGAVMVRSSLVLLLQVSPTTKALCLQKQWIVNLVALHDAFFFFFFFPALCLEVRQHSGLY